MRARRRSTLAVYWGGACGGCDVALLNVGQRLLDLAQEFEIVFWPCVADFRRSDVVAREAGSIDLCLFNGTIRTEHDAEMARLLRDRSRFLVAFGSCAHEGCVPALANLAGTDALRAAVFLCGATNVNPERIVPGSTVASEGGVQALPSLLDEVLSLEQTVPVDYTVPGCPPEPGRVIEVLELLQAALAGERELPEPGSVLGAGGTAVCEECPLAREPARVTAFVRPFAAIPDGTNCLLHQGLVCCGPATRAGCGALCPLAGMGCRGCYGPLDGSHDIGARLVAALAAVIECGSSEQSPESLRDDVETAMAGVVDPAGTFYRFGMAGSLLRRARLGADGSAFGSGHGARHD